MTGPCTNTGAFRAPDRVLELSRLVGHRRITGHVCAGQVAHQPGHLDPAAVLSCCERLKYRLEFRRADAVAAEPGVDLQVNPWWSLARRRQHRIQVRAAGDSQFDT